MYAILQLTKNSHRLSFTDIFFVLYHRKSFLRHSPLISTLFLSQTLSASSLPPTASTSRLFHPPLPHPTSRHSLTPPYYTIQPSTAHLRPFYISPTLSPLRLSNLQPLHCAPLHPLSPASLSAPHTQPVIPERTPDDHKAE